MIKRMIKAHPIENRMARQATDSAAEENPPQTAPATRSRCPEESGRHTIIGVKTDG
jgi:hypothetical protein